MLQLERFSSNDVFWQNGMDFATICRSEVGIINCWFVLFITLFCDAQQAFLLLYQGLEPLPQMHCSHRLIVQPWNPPLCLDIPTFTTRCLHVLHDARDPNSKRWNFVGENDPVVLPKCRLPRYMLGIFYVP